MNNQLKVSDEVYKKRFNGFVDPVIGDVYRFNDIHNHYDGAEHYAVVTQVYNNGSFDIMSLPEGAERRVYKRNWVGGCEGGDNCSCISYAFTFPHANHSMMKMVIDLAKNKY